MREAFFAALMLWLLVAFVVGNGWLREVEARAVPGSADVCACECDGDALGVLHAWEQGWIVRDPTTGEPVVVR